MVKRMALAVGLGLLAILTLSSHNQARAIPIPSTTLDVTWDVTSLGTPDVYRYRYIISNTGNQPVSVRLTVLEDQVSGHAGLHHETNFVNAGATFLYDQAIGLAIPPHDYDWSNLTVPANGTVTVGFDDVHGPRPESLFIDGQLVSDFAVAPGFPFGKAETDGGDKGFQLEGSVAAAQAAGGFQYKYFLRNIGNIENIGPPPASNHADYYVNEHPTHAGIHHENFNEADNAIANDNRPFDCFPAHNAPQEPTPPPTSQENYCWQGLGFGAVWNVGKKITLGFFDPHPPARAPWGGRVVASPGDTVIVDETQPDNLAVVPVFPVVGGMAERVVDSSDSPGSASDGAGLSAGLYAAIAGGMAVAAAVVAVAAGGWYARRRFGQRRVR